MTIDPRYDLAGFINEAQDDGSSEEDPYSYVMVGVATLLEHGLDDGIVGSMNTTERAILEQLMDVIRTNDPAVLRED